MGKSSYKIASGYVHWRKSQYEVDETLDVAALHSRQLANLPMMPALKTNELSEFLTKAAPPQPALTKFSTGDQTKNMQNYTGNIFVSDIRGALAEAHSQGLDSKFTWTKHRRFEDVCRVTGKDVEQLTREYKEVLNFLRKAITTLQKGNGSNNAQHIANLQQLKKRYESNQRRLQDIEKQLRRDRNQYLPRHWVTKSQTVKTNSKTKTIEEIVNDLENIQVLYALPTAKQYGEAQEKVLASIKATRRKYLKNHREQLARVVKAEQVGRATQVTHMQGLQMAINKTPFLNLEQLNKEIKELSNMSEGATPFTVVSDGSSTTITTKPSAQTVDVMIEMADNTFGTKDLRASVKAYQKSDNVHIVNGAPLSTILELSLDDNFLIHYMNIMSQPNPDSAPLNNDAMRNPNDSPEINSLRGDMNLYMRRLMAMRALMGVRGRDMSNIANVLLVTEGRAWKAYDIGQIIRGEKVLSALKISDGNGLNPIPMDWVDVRDIDVKNSQIATFGATKERINKLYAQIHALKLNVSINLNKI